MCFEFIGGEGVDEGHGVEADQSDGEGVGYEVVVEGEGSAFGDVG
jgi:hypothetical protein